MNKLKILEVKKLLKSVRISQIDKRDEQEVVGYYEALEIILQSYTEIELTETLDCNFVADLTTPVTTISSMFEDCSTN